MEHRDDGIEVSQAQDDMDGLSIEQAEDAFRLKQKLDSNSIIQALRFKPVGASRLKIPLCRMIRLPLVRPLLLSDVKRLESEFVHGYREGDRVFYVSITDDTGSSQLVTEEIISSWDLHWVHENNAFEKQLLQDEHWASLCGHMFFIWDGNHRHQAWSTYISRFHSDDANWHYSVDSILLASKGNTGILMNAMNDINRSVLCILEFQLCFLLCIFCFVYYVLFTYNSIIHFRSTENAHVKTNLVHRLHRINTYGMLDLAEFKELLTKEEFKACENRTKPFAWYPLTSEVFIKFLNRVSSLFDLFE